MYNMVQCNLDIMKCRGTGKHVCYNWGPRRFVQMLNQTLSNTTAYGADEFWQMPTPSWQKIMTPVIYLTPISFTSHLKILAVNAYKCVQVFCLLFGNFYTWAMAPQKAAGALIVILHHKSAEDYNTYHGIHSGLARAVSSKNIWESLRG